MEYTDVLRCLSIEDSPLAEHIAALVAIDGAFPTYSALTDAAIGRAEVAP